MQSFYILKHVWHLIKFKRHNKIQNQQKTNNKNIAIVIQILELSDT